MIKKWLLKMSDKAHQDSMKYMNSVTHEYWEKEDKRPLRVLDIGVDKGHPTLKILKGLNNVEIVGIDIVDNCQYDQIKMHLVDIEKERLPFENNYFDIVFSHQVIEHLMLKNEFIKKCERVLKSNGLFMVATENIASFDNIISLLLGQEPINQHSSGSGKRINTFLSPRYGLDLDEEGKILEHGHKNLPSYFSLTRMVKQNKFKDVKMKSFGGLWPLSVLAPFYNRILVLKAYKK